MPVVGFRKHVLETGEPLLDQRGHGRRRSSWYGNPTAVVGEAAAVCALRAAR